jgi:adenosylcobinamide amidohydrolase
MLSNKIGNSNWYFVLNYDSTRKFSVQFLGNGCNDKRDIVTYREGAPHYEAYTTETGKAIPKFVAKAIWEAMEKSPA